MMVFKKIIIIVFLFNSSAWAEKSDVKEHLLRVITQEVKKECLTCRVELNIFNEKSIDDISVPDKVLADHWRGQTNLILKTEQRDRIITVEIRWYDKVLVASRNIRIGGAIDKKDVRIYEKDVTFLKTPYLNKIDKARGLVAKRVFQRGQVIDESKLKKPLVVRYGQPIKIILQEGAIHLSTMGQAKGAGAIGDRIPVYVSKTRKKMMGKIISENKVRVE